MCLSKVYDSKRDDDSLVVDEVTSVNIIDGKVEINTLLGSSEVLEGYIIGEVNSMENYVILRSTGE
ncbi:CooT family nickel-binding protein [Spirochaetota bacterium]